MKVKTRKRYWLLWIPLVAVFTLGIGLLFVPLAWLLDRSMAKAAYYRQLAGLPPSWYDHLSMWEFELAAPTGQSETKEVK